METRRFIKSALFITLALILVTTLIPRNACAWGNVEAHPEINRLAIKLLQQRANSDPSLAALKNSSLDGDSCWGMAWDVADGNALIQRKSSTSRQKTLSNWIIDGGYSADEPEGPAAMRHFYDPTNKGHLTDTDWIAGFLRLTLGSQAVNPEISAVEWAMNEDEGAAKMDVFFSQDYSYPDAKEYFKQALADKSRDNPNYGNAWRAVGETMHLVADMGLSPHVRNDGHGLGDADPVEGATTAAIISQNNNTNWTSTINYDQSIKGLMHELATFTNKNFFSKDTIPVAGKPTTANGRPAYPNPSIANLTISKSGYLEGKVDGVTVKLARQSGWYRWGLSKNPGYVIDDAVIKDQQRILTPTIIRASEAVLERFLPRFEATASVKPNPDVAGRYTVIGGVNLKPSAEWSERLTIRNGAYVALNGKKEAIKLVNQDNLNEFSYSITGKAGDQVQVIYDLGGYVIKSEIVTIASPTPLQNNIAILQKMTHARFSVTMEVTEDNSNYKAGTHTSGTRVSTIAAPYGVLDNSNIPITWSGLSFTGKSNYMVGKSSQRTHEISGTVSADGKTLNVKYSYQRKDVEGTVYQYNETVGFEFSNVPLDVLVTSAGGERTGLTIGKSVNKFEFHTTSSNEGKPWSDIKYLNPVATDKSAITVALW